MADDEVVQPEPTEQEVTPDETPVAGVDYEDLGEGRFRWSDGTVADEDGNALEEETSSTTTASAPATTPPATTSAPPAATTTASAPVVAPQTTTTPQPAYQPQPQQPQRQFYTRQATRDAIFTDAALEEIGNLALTDPVRAERARMGLQEQYQSACANIDRYGSQIFDTELDELSRVPQFTEPIQRFGRQIEQRKNRLTPEEKQQPGVARHVLAQALAEEFVRDPLAMQEAVMRSLRPDAGSRPPAPDAGASPAPKRPVIPASDRMPGPGTARRSPTPRRPAGGTNALQSAIEFQKRMYPPDVHHQMTEADYRAMAQEQIDADESRRRTVNR